MLSRPLALALLTTTLCLSAGADDEKLVTIASFDAGIPNGVEHVGGELSHIEKHLAWTLDPKPKPGEIPRLTIPLPEGVDLSKGNALEARLRFTATFGGRKLRWRALDENDRVLFQRVVSGDNGMVWQRFSWPLALWRWGAALGKWSEVRKLTLDIESGRGTVSIDELRLRQGSPHPAGEWLPSLAFVDREVRTVTQGEFRIITDATPKQIADETLRKTLARVQPVPAWVKRRFGDALRPVKTGKPYTLVLFKNHDDYRSFFVRLGTAWRVSITPPRGSGYTVQDIAAAMLDRRPNKSNTDRPVFFHELVHVVVARQLRLLSGSPGHDWLQEAVANYLQVCLFPESVQPAWYKPKFGRPLDRQGRGGFAPLEVLFDSRARLTNYLQLASMLCFIIRKHPGWLPKIALALADGKTAAEALEACKSTVHDLQRAWYDWGAAEKETPKALLRKHFTLQGPWKVEDGGKK